MPTTNKTAAIKETTVSIEKAGSQNILVIRIPMQEPAPSASGKTLVVATTRGNIKTGIHHAGGEIVVGLNAYIPAK